MQFIAIIALTCLSVAQSQFHFESPPPHNWPHSWPQNWPQSWPQSWNIGGGFVFPNSNNIFNHNRPPPSPSLPLNQRSSFNQRPVNRPSIPPPAQPTRPATPAPNVTPPKSRRISKTSMKRLKVADCV
jgi:hypothetical protein